MVTRLPAAAPSSYRDRNDHTLLVLQGGGALGAYQAGVYEALSEAGFAPDWVTGVSIGAINAALIAGNPPARRAHHVRRSRLLRAAHSPRDLRAPRYRCGTVGVRHGAAAGNAEGTGQLR